MPDNRCRDPEPYRAAGDDASNRSLEEPANRREPMPSRVSLPHVLRGAAKRKPCSWDGGPSDDWDVLQNPRWLEVYIRWLVDPSLTLSPSNDSMTDLREEYQRMGNECPRNDTT